MNDSLAVRAAFDIQRFLAQASITASYKAIGTSSSFPIRLLYVVNDTNALAQFSDDGINDKFVVGSGGFVIFDISSDQSHGNGLFLPIGTTIYVKQSSASMSGSGVYVTILYGANP